MAVPTGGVNQSDDMSYQELVRLIHEKKNEKADVDNRAGQRDRDILKKDNKRDVLQKQEDDLFEQLQQLSKEIAEHEEELRELEELKIAYTKVKERISTIAQKADAIRKRISDTCANYKVIVSENDQTMTNSMGDAQTRTKNTTAKMRTMNLEFQTEIQLLDKDIAELEAVIKEKQNLYDTILERFNATVTAKEKIIAEVDELKSEVEDLKEKSRNLELTIEKLEEEKRKRDAQTSSISDV